MVTNTTSIYRYKISACTMLEYKDKSLLDGNLPNTYLYHRKTSRKDVMKYMDHVLPCTTWYIVVCLLQVICKLNDASQICVQIGIV